MNKEDFAHFVCIVASENPDEVVKKYDKNNKVAPYVVYKYADRDKIRRSFIAMYEAMLKSEELGDYERHNIQDALDYTKDETAEEFYSEICEDYGYTVDKETGDAYTTENPDGRYKSIQIGNVFSRPFILKDGRESYQARKKDIDWEKMHLYGRETYEAAWDMVIEGKKPTNDYEQNIYDNMKYRTAYFKKFGDRENYVVSSTAFWGYAFVGDNQKWEQLEDHISQFEWVSGFFDKYIKPLPEDTLLTVMECTA